MRLIPPDVTGWATRFRHEVAVIRRAVPAAAAIEHVGSTALGIDSKDVVDVLVGVDPMTHEPVVAALGRVGFTREGTRTTAEGEPHSWLTRLVHGHRVTVVHVVAAAGAEWHRRTAFRDALRDDEALRTAYVAPKRDIAGDTEDWSEYTARKSSFVRRVLAGRPGPGEDVD
jgi:GrpB-like predicted nucleotidyltransferase (UPF0157 family)